MSSFLKSFVTFKGDKVDMNLLEMLMYGLIPGFGQLLMRVDKFGGSLDKPYLLFPLLLFPPFSFIPVLIAKFGFLKKEKGENILDIYVIIPIIFRFILIFVMAQIGSPGGVLLQAGLIFAAIFITNLIHVLTEERCKSVSGVSGGFGGKLVKEMADSMIEYAAGVLLLFSTEFIPVVGEFLEGLRDIPFPGIGKISQVIDTTIWSIGLVCGYMVMNMIDVNYYSANEACTGKIGAIRIIISIIAFAVAFFYQFHGQIMNMVTNII
jgi:hypothetical protein